MSAVADARRLVEESLPEAELRRSMLEVLASSIRTANETNPQGWELTLATSRKKRLRLNVGPMVVFTIRPEWIDFSIAADEKLVARAAELAAQGGLKAPEAFDLPGDLVWIHLPADVLVETWGDFRPAHEAVIMAVAQSAKRTPFWWAHSPEALEFLNEELGTDLPQPGYPIGEDALRARGKLDEHEVQGVAGLRGLVEAMYPLWSGFTDPRFEKDERAYKLTACEQAQELLSEEQLTRLSDAANFDEIIDRIDKVGKATNLLYTATPMAGDLNVLYQEELDKAEFARAFKDLMHGEGEGPERLARYLEFIESSGLPNKWTFPTYFLFLLHPEDEFFIKPSVTQWMLGRLEMNTEVSHRTPSAATYAEVRAVAHELLSKLESEGARDMVDVQSFVWTAHASARGKEDPLVDARKLREFEALLSEFADSYAGSEKGKEHLASYDAVRNAGRANFQAIVEAADEGEDVTDRVLYQLFPRAITRPQGSATAGCTRRRE